ncbi:SRPBCC domain-containing protein [Devosia sp.]|uniref:SRPBCC family protein n=1 Tax=Devosia sp. TaxID=1871048 RepID=UPI0032648989
MTASSEMMADDLVLEFTRVFDAPAALVFKLWSEPEHMVRWHGPQSMWLTECKIDFRVGGKWRRCMSNAPDHQHWIHGEYTEIVPNTRLCFTYINDYDGHSMLVEMDFAERDGKTEMRFRQGTFANVRERDGHGWGWASGFDLFADYLGLVKQAGGKVVGQPRIDGVAADIVAARKRQQEQQQQQQ